MEMKKVIVLGSGGIKIGEAGEFDYSGSQCIKALKEEGINVVLINPNIATIQTSDYLADKVYFLPVNADFVEKIIEKEKPDGILLGFGGQTALNAGVELDDKGVFKKYNVEVLGTQVDAIKNTEDRDLFIKKLNEIELKTPRSFAVNSVEEALNAAKKIQYPIMLRIAYALGGLGSGKIINEEELEKSAKRAFRFTNQILIEECLNGWKEIEYEVVRDRYDNCITVCNMENLDPMGIHTGESIVVAPTQTLTNKEHHMLREISIKLIRHLGIVGECNIQFALNPFNEEYRIIEVNARLSRSSALASKATGYPLAFIATKLSLGYSLADLENRITKKTKCCFEPALDYVVLKIPRWDLQKFSKAKNILGTEMKSVGEIMAIGRKFEEVLQKAIRMLQIGMYGLVCNKSEIVDYEDIKNPTDKRIFVIAEALKKGISIDEIYEWSKIDKWFLYKLKNIVDIEKKLRNCELDKEIILEAKQHGFSDAQIGIACSKNEEEIKELRNRYEIKPVVKQIDTLGGEFSAQTNYLYLTYNGEEDDIDFSDKNKVIVLGGGSYRIGSSVEFDWCCVNAVFTLRKMGYKTIMINFNPETVSTDYDECDKLYFDELSFECVREIYEKENPLGIIISMGGQIPNNLAMKFNSSEIKVLGTSPENIDRAEDRNKFSKLLDSLGISQPPWMELKTLREAEIFSKDKYPVLVRPSYVLSGSAMSVVFNEKDLEKYLKKATDISEEHPVVISKFIKDAKEIEIDAVADKGELIAWAISEHVENAGVHSGDATLVFPPQKLYSETIKKIEDITRKIAFALKISGPFNMQFIAKNNDVGVIECNLRASRSFPFISKVSKKNFIEVATKSIMGIDNQKIGGIYNLNYVGVKAPQFSFLRLKGADPIQGVEMTSTGEVACLGKDLNDAFLKSILSTGFKLPKKNILISLGGERNKYELLEYVMMLKNTGFDIFATEHTSEFFNKYDVDNIMVYKINENKHPNISELIAKNKFDLVINIPQDYSEKELEIEYAIRREAVDFSIPLITNIQLARLFINALTEKKDKEIGIESWDEFK